MEEWRTVAEFPNYEVSNTGKVRNIDTKKELAGHILNVHARIAEDYNISDSTVDCVVSGKLWKSVVQPQKG